MFLLNSRMGPFTAPPGIALEDPFFRSYGVILPSSLTRVLSLTLVFSTRLPVSVCGTGMFSLARSFSWQCDYITFATFTSLLITAHVAG